MDNDAILTRLNSIDDRLSRLEDKTDKMSEHILDVHERAVRNDERIADVEGDRMSDSRDTRNRRTVKATILASLLGGTIGAVATIVAQVMA